MSDAIEHQLGQYQLTELIRRSTMSAIYKAYQPSLARFVAIKVLFSEGDPQFALRFKRSARMSAGLQHPNILQTYDFGEQGDRLFLVLQYVEGGVTLDSLLGMPLSLADAAQLMVRLLDALDYAHKRGIIHRDVKPANIMMSTPSWPLLGDFGIAKLRSDTQRVTSSGLTIGTPAYMSPEQATGRSLDARTDLYAAGLVFYTMLTGRVPFDADSPMDMMLKQVYDPPILPRSLNPDISPEIEQLVLRTLEKDPGARYQSALEMAEAIRSLAPEPAQPQPRDEIANLYQAGAQALEAGQSATAIELLSQLVALEPAYKDAAVLLDVARAAQQHVRSAGGRVESTNVAAQSARQLMQPAHTTEHVGQRASQPAAARTPPPAATAKITDEQPASRAGAFHCPRCGREIHPDWSACPYCRETLSGIAAVPTPAEPPALSGAPDDFAAAGLTPAPRRRGWPRWAEPIALLVLLGLGAVAGLVLARRAPAPSDSPVTQAAAIQPTTQSQAATAARLPTAAPTTIPTAMPPTAAPTMAPTAPPPTALPPTAPPPDAIVNLEQLRLRNGPSTNFSFQHTYTRGTVLTVIGKEPTGTWLKVQAPDGQTGWMRAADLQLNMALDTLPIAEAPPSPTASPTAKPRPTAVPTAPPPAPTDTPIPTDTPAPTEPPMPTETLPTAPTEPPTAMPTEPTPTEDKVSLPILPRPPVPTETTLPTETLPTAPPTAMPTEPPTPTESK